ncbi:MAG: hypothetical protein ACI841_002620 [Planctomycetota bacterium]|jgi:hypothetical protein
MICSLLAVERFHVAKVFVVHEVPKSGDRAKVIVVQLNPLRPVP